MTTPILAFSGPSGVGKTHLLVRLIPALARRGVSVAVLKHTSHRHRFDARGKDSERLRRAGARAAVIQGPVELALFAPPVTGARALARLLPPVDLVIAEGFKTEKLSRVEVHRRVVSRAFLCARDASVIAVVTDEEPPRRGLPVFASQEVEALADFVCSRFRVGRGARKRTGRSPTRARHALGGLSQAHPARRSGTRT
jgi:molybdopterin-guanine dinucleotide biosynthesis protein B